MDTRDQIVTRAESAEAARLIDADATPVASIGDPGAGVDVRVFREAVLISALGRADVAGVLFASRWGGGGEMIT